MNLAFAVIFAASPAHAVDVDSYAPSSSQVVGTGTLQGESPTLPTLDAAGGVLMGFVQNPAVRRTEDGSTTDVVASLVPMTLYGGWTQEDVGRFDLFVPVYAHVDAPQTGYGGAALGDARLQAVLPFPVDGPVQIGFVPRIEIPTGSRDALVRRGFSAGGHFALGGESSDATLGWLANLGLTGAAAEQFGGVALGSTVDAVVGGWARATDAFRVGADVDLHAGLARSDAGANTWSTAHLFAQQVVPSGWGMTLGGGTGLIGGVGAPEYRILFGVHYGAAMPDPDGDGLTGSADQCANIPEDMDGYQDSDGCPDDDNDGDGVSDADDQCPDEQEDADGFQDDDGCLDADNDGDGMADAYDACPDAAGNQKGCPDSDGDGLSDADDACPRRKKPAEERLEFSDGCPKDVYLTDFAIAHTTPIEFDGDALAPAGIGVLDDVAALWDAHPEITKIEVRAPAEGQALAVVAWLIERRIPGELSVAAGESGIEFRIKAVDRDRALSGQDEEEPEPEEPVAAEGPGSLTVVVEGGAQATVFVDAERIQRSAPFVDLPIEAGGHFVRIVGRGIDELHTIEVQPGETTRIVVKPKAAPVLDIEEEPEPEDEPEQVRTGKRPPRNSKKR